MAAAQNKFEQLAQLDQEEADALPEMRPDFRNEQTDEPQPEVLEQAANDQFQQVATPRKKQMRSAKSAMKDMQRTQKVVLFRGCPFMESSTGDAGRYINNGIRRMLQTPDEKRLEYMNKCESFASTAPFIRERESGVGVESDVDVRIKFHHIMKNLTQELKAVYQRRFSTRDMCDYAMMANDLALILNGVDINWEEDRYRYVMAVGSAFRKRDVLHNFKYNETEIQIALYNDDGELVMPLTLETENRLNSQGDTGRVMTHKALKTPNFNVSYDFQVFVKDQSGNTLTDVISDLHLDTAPGDLRLSKAVAEAFHLMCHLFTYQISYELENIATRTEFTDDEMKVYDIMLFKNYVMPLMGVSEIALQAYMVYRMIEERNPMYMTFRSIRLEDNMINDLEMLDDEDRSIFFTCHYDGVPRSIKIVPHTFKNEIRRQKIAQATAAVDRQPRPVPQQTFGFNTRGRGRNAAPIRGRGRGGTARPVGYNLNSNTTFPRLQ